jgi:DNA cross-link repair 1A protein
MSDQPSRIQPLSRNWSPAAKPGATHNPVGKMPASSIQRQSTITPSKSATVANTAPRPRGPRQTSLTSWFGSSPAGAPTPAQQPAPSSDLFYNETPKLSKRDDTEPPAKKPRLSQDEDEDLLPPATDIGVTESRDHQSLAHSSPLKSRSEEKRKGGFIVDSDDSDAESSVFEGPSVDNVPKTNVQDDTQGGPDGDIQYNLSESEWKNNGDLQPTEIISPEESLKLQPKRTLVQPSNEGKPSKDTDACATPPAALEGTVDPERPPLLRQDTSLYTPAEFGDEDFEADEFYEEGEEYLERRWMEEQAEMEAAFDEDSKSESGTESVRTPTNEVEIPELVEQESIASCPICDGSLKGLTEAQASSHVNACLDGSAPALPKLSDEAQAPPVEVKSRSASPFKQPAKPAHRFQRAAIARPPQANPFSAAKDGKANRSAFTKLMSGHAEDLAWAEAAANEKDSRGKPSYQRTCPFYKIMPGFFICVDAFRYGKVEGQSAYFLSHFHSDHYIGLTANWSHGPIYASKVTCNLMRQCLRVDKKYIRVLEFEKKYEVPDTKGVYVTMIPANHCPGSSIYLFEKVTGKNRDGSDRLTRILHCGDFRACPAHVNHPLLRPNLVNAVSGATKEQWIDTCYLDTTYLTPKYAFPSQSDVIDACAAMCVSMSNEIADPSDAWESSKAQRMGATMSKFLEAGDEKLVKPEPEEELDSKADLKPRGRLLVVIGTYSIGKERICLGIAKALNSKIYAPPNKMAICRALEDAELNSRLTSNKYEAQVHMQILFEIRAETLHDYLVPMKPHFSRVVGFRPTGWNYRPPTSRFTENPAVDMILHSDGWKSRFSLRDLVPQRGSTKESNCFGVPYSEHSSFRELTMFCSALRIKKVIPTVNVGSAKSREKMKKWIDKWAMEQKKKGLFEWKCGEGGSGGDTERFEGLHYGV